MNTMNAQPLYDLAPIAWLLGFGVLLALGPLLWLWRRHAGSGAGRYLQALTVLTLFLTFDLTLFGAFTRLSDSGLGCPDWPGCYGNASPFGASHEIAMAQAAQPTGPVTHGKAWVEMVHRYLATGVGFLILVLALATWRVRRRERKAPPQGTARGLASLSAWWPAATLVWVCLQGAFGALTVTWRLYPAIVTLHLLGAMVLLALLCIQAVRYSQASEARLPSAVPGALHKLLWWTAGLLVLQIALGGWVSTNYAVLACTQFPTCQDSWWPPMNFAQGFEIWRELGTGSNGMPIEFAALTAIHYVHRLMAYLVFASIGVLAWQLLRRAPALRTQALWLIGLALLQLATGLGNVLLGWPLLAALLHTGGAAALAVVLTWTLCESRREPAAAAARTRQTTGVEAA
jgi:cytochrome c oxidase assembly protein subunit 15